MKIKHCVTCKTEFETKTNRQTCSEKCRHKLAQSKINHKERVKKAKATNIEKYGVDNIMKTEQGKENFKTAMKEKYGVEFSFQLPEVKEKAIKNAQSNNAKDKRKKTLLKTYGAENTFGSEEILEKIKCSNKEKYGYENPMKNPEVAAKGIETKKSIYGVDYGKMFYEKSRETSNSKFGCDNWAFKHIKNFEKLNDVEFVLNAFIKDNRFLIQEMMEYFNLQEAYVNRWKRENNITIPNKIKKSATQQKLFDSLDIREKYMNTREVIPPLEIDIYLPESNLAIEYNGLMFHSRGVSFSDKFHSPDFPKDYHLKKTLMCEEQGIQLLHIFEGEDLEIWKSVINSKLGLNEKLYARKCIIKEIEFKEVSEFLEENHLQGICNSKINLGLFYNNVLVSLMTFGKSRFNKNYDFELLRFCNLKGYNVIGGASKLLKHFRKHNKGSIISYANRRWSNGKLYETLGFAKIGETPPNYWYFKEYKTELFSRIQFQKHKLKNILEHFDANLSETQNMLNHGYRQIFDCGNLVYILE